ncbi:MAG: hypothetical protein ACKVIN_00605 [Longimicrobiales bacterium]
MINTRNTLGTTGLSDLRAVLFGIALTVAALVLLAQQGQAQDATQEQVELTFTLFGSLVDGPGPGSASRTRSGARSPTTKVDSASLRAQRGGWH